MKKITKEVLTKIIIEYYCQEEGWTQNKLADKISVNHSSISNWLNNQNISERSFSLLLSFLKNDINNKNKDEHFCKYLSLSLQKEKYDTTNYLPLINARNNIASKMKELIRNYGQETSKLQSVLSLPSIIARIKKICYIYDKFFSVSTKEIRVDKANPLINKVSEKEKNNNIQETNYIFLNFPCKYGVMLIFTNHIFDDTAIYSHLVKQIKEKNYTNLIIVITDNEVKFETQRFFLDNYNLFFETITNKDLEKTKISNASIKELSKSDKVFAYAQTVFDRFISYFPVIKNEIIFKKYETKHKSSKYIEMIEEKDIIKKFADKILLKDIFNYSYLSRHAIYFERNRLNEEVKEMLKDNNSTSLGVVMEICCPNAFLTSGIFDKCEKIMLFTSSGQSLRMFNDINEENDEKLLSDNLQLSLTHIHPKYIADIYGQEIVGKVDLIVLGFGIGSSIVNITEYLRYINSWLAPNGRIFISFINYDSVILQKQFDLYNKIETSPLLFSDFGKHTIMDNIDLLVKLKRYTLEEAKTLISTYVEVDKYYTYPFLSGLISNTNGEKNLANEIREIDKEYALSDKCKHGHYIIIIGRKQCIQSSEINTTNGDKAIRHKIYDYLDSNKVDYEIIKHAMSVDTKSLLLNLLEKGEDINEFDLLKTIVFQAKADKKKKNCFQYVITLADNNLSYASNIRLVSEKKVTKIFGQGSISPMVILVNDGEEENVEEKYYAVGLQNLAKEYVIFSSGSNTESIKIQSDIFIELLQKKKVNFLEVDSVIGE